MVLRKPRFRVARRKATVTIAVTAVLAVDLALWEYLIRRLLEFLL